MKKKAIRFSATLLLFVTAASIAFAGGYQINELDARATGMAGAFVARAYDPSAIFFNAAGLGFQTGINATIGTTLIFPSTTYTGPGTLALETKTAKQTFFPSNIYGAYAINSQWVVGLGVYNPYGLGTQWPTEWPGQRHLVKADLQTYYINPTVAYKVSDELAFGAGVSVVWGNAKISQRVQAITLLGAPTSGATDGTVTLDGNGNGVSVNVGAIYKPMPKLSLGAAFRSLTNLKLKGTATFTNMQLLQKDPHNYFPGGDGDVTLPMPANIVVCAAYDVDPKLTVEADLQYTLWSAYKNLAITIADGPVVSTLPPPYFGHSLQTSPPVQSKNWNDGIMLRLGGEYKLDDKVMLRLGYIRDMTPQPLSKIEPMLPDANRNDITVGGSYQLNERLSFDAAYMMVLFEDRSPKLIDTPLDLQGGTYKSSANLVSLNVNYHF